MAVSGTIWTELCDTAPAGEAGKQKMYGLKGSASDGVYVDHDGSAWRVLDGSGVLIPARLPATVMHTDQEQTVTEPLTVDTGVDEKQIIVDGTANSTDHAVHIQTATGTKAFHLSRAAPGSGNYCEFAIEDLGIHEWGAGSASPRDTRLQRSAASTLQIDDNAGGDATLNVIGEIQQSGVGVALLDALPNRNLLINGGFGIWQRQSNPATATTYDDDTYCGADRWYILSSQANAIQTSRIDGDEQRYALRLKQNIATATQPGLAQIIEGVNCRHLRGKTVTLRLRVRCSVAGKLLQAGVLEWSGTEDDLTTSGSHDFVSVWAGTPTLVANMALPSGASYGSVTSAADTWQEMVYTATLGSGFNNLVVFLFSGDTLAQNTTLDVEAVQVEAGEAPTPFEVRPTALELPLCQYYYQRAYYGDGGYAGLGGAASADAARFYARLLPVMRTAPSISSSGEFQLQIGVAGQRFDTTLTFDNISATGYRIIADIGTASLTTELVSLKDKPSGIDGYLIADAEL